MREQVAVHYAAGVAHARAGRLREAAKAYEAALRLAPERSDVRLNLGMAYKGLGLHAQAAAELREVMRRDPMLAAAAAIDLGAVYEDLGRYDAAVASFRDAVRLEPTSAPAHYALGRVLLIVGARDEAEDEYRLLRALDATWAERLRLLLAP